MKKHSPNNENLRKEYNKLFKENKILKDRVAGLIKQNEKLNEVARDLQLNMKDRVMEAVKIYGEKQKERKENREKTEELDILKKEMEKLRAENKKIKSEMVWLKLTFRDDVISNLEKLNKELEERNEKLVLKNQKIEETERQLEDELKEKQNIIKVQSMNNRVLIEEIMRLRGNK